MSDSENTAIPLPAEHVNKPNMTIPEQLDAAQTGEEFGQSPRGLVLGVGQSPVGR